LRSPPGRVGGVGYRRTGAPPAAWDFTTTFTERVTVEVCGELPPT
jgi:hypothetical protein